MTPLTIRHSNTHTHTHTHTNTYTYTHTYIHFNTHTYILTQTHRRAINYPPRGIGASTQDAFFRIHDAQKRVPSSDVLLHTPILDMLLLVGSVAERKANMKKAGGVKSRVKKGENKTVKEDEEDEEDDENINGRENEDTEYSSYIRSKYSKTKDEEAVVESLTPRQLKTLSEASKYVWMCCVTYVMSCDIVWCQVMSFHMI